MKLVASLVLVLSMSSAQALATQSADGWSFGGDIYPLPLKLHDFSKTRSAPNTRHKMIDVVVPHLYFITT